MHATYVNPAIRELRDQLVRFAPREKKIEQAELAEKLLGEIDPTRTYSYEYLCFRITNYRPQSYPDLRLSGEEACHDLRLFVEDVSDAANIPSAAAGEPVLTVEELSRHFNVSTKTIARWRQQGLVSRRFLFGRRKRVGFLQSSVERFVHGNEDRVRRGSRFSQLSEKERDLIIEQGRRLSQAGGAPSEVARRLAGSTGRSVETIRYTIKQFDRDNPRMAVFSDSSGPLQEPARRMIYHQYRRGESVGALARRFGRTKTSIYRVIGEMRAQKIMELPLDYIPNEQFSEALANKSLEEEILASLPAALEPMKKPRLPSGLPSYLASLYQIPLLERHQEAHLFRKLNYLKFRAHALRDKLDPTRPRTSQMDDIEKIYSQAVATKNEIIRANLRLVVSIAKRHMGQGENFFELVSDGNISLIRAVEKFDYSRGNKFSTYASWAIMKNFARTIPDEHRYHDRFRTSPAEVFTSTEDSRTDQYGQETAHLQRRSQIERILARLDEREQRIIINRFGLERGEEPRTLKEVGSEMGVTKERVRQIEARALTKLRRAAKEDRLDVPDGDEQV